MQQEIEQVLFSNLSKDEKISKIRDVFERFNISIFSDLDDTIWSNDSLFQAKIKILIFLKKFDNISSIYDEALKYFKINPGFLLLLNKHKIKWKIFILSRNDYFFVKKFIEKYWKKYSDYGIEIVWWLWVVWKFEWNILFDINTEDKLKLTTKDSALISDIFEYNVLKSHPWFLNVNTNNKFFLKFFIILKKLFHSIIFLLKNV